MSILPGMAAVFGVLAVAYAQATEINILQNNIDDARNQLGTTRSEQSSICAAVRLTYDMQNILI